MWTKENILIQAKIIEINKNVGIVRYAEKGDEQARMVCQQLFLQEFLQVSWTVLSPQQDGSGPNPGLKKETPHPRGLSRPLMLSPPRTAVTTVSGGLCRRLSFLSVFIVRLGSWLIGCFTFGEINIFSYTAVIRKKKKKRCELCVLFLIAAPKCWGGNQFHPKYVLPYTDGH